MSLTEEQKNKIKAEEMAKLSNNPAPMPQSSWSNKVLKGFFVLFIIFNVFALFVRAINNATKPTSYSSTVQPVFQTAQIINAPDLVKQTYLEISKQIGQPTNIDNQTPPVFSHYEWDLQNYNVYAEAELPNAKSKISYLEIKIPNKCNKNTTNALKIFGLPQPATTGKTTNDITTWEPFGNYDRVRLWCEGTTQAIRIIPDSTVGQ